MDRAVASRYNAGMSPAANPASTTAVKKRGGPFRGLLVAYLRPLWPRALLLFVLMFAGVALQLVNPLVLGSFIDNATGGGTLDTLMALALLYLGLAFIAQFATVAETYVAQDIALTATNRLRVD